MAAPHKSGKTPVDVLIVAVPETAGSALYGMVDVLKAAGSVWETLTRQGNGKTLFNVRIVALRRKIFVCGNGIPVKPDCVIDDNPKARVIILPELWLGPDKDIRDRYPTLMTWLRRAYKRGGFLYSACSGAVMLAATGLLDGCSATSHWAYQELFRKRYPNVQFHPEPNLVIADRDGRIVTAGGTTSWHDLAIHIIARHANPGEALRIAKVYLLKWHGEGQLPYAPLSPISQHADSVVRECERQLDRCYRESDVIQHIIGKARIPERTLKRRFKAATGITFIEYVQNLRIEEAKRLLETTDINTEGIGAAVGYEDLSFFHRLFKRLTGLTPAKYRRMFQPVLDAGATV
jgi:transcriptional regulator GlxA family with amidase domain